MILFGEGSLRRAIREFIEHYHHERNHQGLGNRLIVEEEPRAAKSGAIQCRQRVRRNAELLLSSGGLKAPAKSSETTEAIRRQGPQNDASTHGGNGLPQLAGQLEAHREMSPL
jgi:hypothetical protein